LPCYRCFLAQAQQDKRSEEVKEGIVALKRGVDERLTELQQWQVMVL
jgi:hypothetical protein